MSEGRPDTSLSLSVAEAFDDISERFDSELENEITRRIRRKIYSTVEGLVRPGSSLLDINCGTGIDATALASLGYAVTGVDISSKMIVQAQAKASRALPNSLHFFHGSFERLSELVDRPFDLVLSNFGGLNCTPNLASVAEEVARVTSPSGFFLAVVMPRFSLWETLSYAVRGKWNESLRRLREDTIASGFRTGAFVVRYHAPSAFVRAFKPWFDVRRLVGISIFSPTPQATSFVRLHPGLVRGLERLDAMLESLPLFRSIGDHYMAVLQRKKT